MSPLTHAHNILNGFLAGCLVAGGLFSAYGALIQFLLFLFGVFIMVDIVLPEGECAYVITSLLSAAAGFVATLVLSVWGFSIVFLPLVTIVAVVSCFFRLRIRFSA